MPDPEPVNARSKPYHHGDLRAALLRAGLELLATRNADDLSLREISRSVGVTANAVYRHFADKETLMQALAAEGLQMLYVAQRAASERAGGGVKGFVATGAAYVRFAVDNPALFRQMYASPPDTYPMSETDHIADAMAFLRANAAQVASSPAAAEIIALEGWSLAHGMAMLMLDGQVPISQKRITAVFSRWATSLSAAEGPPAKAPSRKRASLS